MPNRAVTTVTRVLASLGRVSPTESGLVLEAAGTRFRFDVRWAGEGYPDDVRRALADRGESAGRTGSRPVTVIAARRLSSGARQLLRERAVNWADESGAAHIVAVPGLLVERAGKPAPPPTPSGRWAWSAASAAVGEVVLADVTATRRTTGATPHLLPGAADLARRAGVSVTLVNTTLRGWQTHGLIDKRGGQRGPTSTRLLVDAGGLLSSWTAWVCAQPVAELAVAATFADPVAWARTELARVMPHGASWCLGGSAAAQLLTPYDAAVSQVLCHVVHDVFDLLRDSLGPRSGLASASTAKRDALILRAAPAGTIALAGPGPVPLASPARVYADLVADGGPDDAAAARFRSVLCGC